MFIRNLPQRHDHDAADGGDEDDSQFAERFDHPCKSYIHGVFLDNPFLDSSMRLCGLQYDGQPLMVIS